MQYSDGDIVPMVKDGNGNIDYIEAAPATEYQEATEKLKRQNTAEELNKTCKNLAINTVDEDTHLTRKQWATQLQDLRRLQRNFGKKVEISSKFRRK